MICALKLLDAPAYPRLFDSMYEDRKKVFVDRLGWDVPHDGRFERDQYDTTDAQYLILNDTVSGEHLGSVRLLPTLGQHILRDVFSHLCDNGVPTGPHIYEITRLIVSPRVDRRDRFNIRNMLGRAMIEYGFRAGIEQYTMVCETAFVSQLLASGWRCDPLGLPQKYKRSTIAALLIHNDRDSIARTRAAWRFESPALRIELRAPLAA